MSRLALAFAALLLAPTALAQQGPGYPPEFLDLIPGWIGDAEALTTSADRERPWWSEAEGFLSRAKAAQQEGRLRIAMFHLETFSEVVRSNQLMDEAASLGSDAQRKTFVVQRTAAWKDDAERAWSDHRARLHAHDGELASLRTIEKAAYAADIALIGILGVGEHEPLAREFPKQAGFPDGYVFALVRASHTPLQAIGWADDLLTAALAQEGLPPRVDDARWAELAMAATSLPAGDTSGIGAELEKRAAAARENNESLLAVTLLFAEQRLSRANGMQTIFGDARSRGLDVVADAARGMRRQLNNTTLDDALDRGLSGVFTVDAMDRVRFTDEFVLGGTAELGNVVASWSALEHANYVMSGIGYASPTPPQPDPASANDTTHPIGKWWDGYRYRNGEADFDYYTASRVEQQTPLGWLPALAAACLVAIVLRRRA